jgi:hypothetical protein
LPLRLSVPLSRVDFSESGWIGITISNGKLVNVEDSGGI